MTVTAIVQDALRAERIDDPADETRAKLKKVSTASIATALYKRGLRNQFIQGVVPVAPKDENMVGPAFTLRYMPAREDRNTLAEFRNPAHPQRGGARPGRPSGVPAPRSTR